MYKEMLANIAKEERYINRYIKLIEIYKEYKCDVFEKHHILPKCLFPEHTNIDWNIIKLPPRVHYIAHYLLYKANIDGKLTFAFNMMNVKSLKSVTHQGRGESQLLNHSRIYDEFKISMLEAIKDSNKDKLTVLDKESEQRVRISTEEYHKNKDKYKHSNTGRVLIILENGEYTTVSTDEFNPKIHTAFSKGIITAEDADGKKYRVSTSDPRYLSGELKYHMNGMLCAKNEEGLNCFISTEEFHNNKDKYTHHAKGKLVVKDENGANLLLTSEEFANSDYNFHTKNKVVVKDKDGNKSQVNVDDPRYLSGELVFNGTGMLNVKDKTGKSIFISTEEYHKNKDKYTYQTNGKATVKDKDGNNFQVPIDDPRIKSGELVDLMSGNVTVKDKNGNTSCVSKNDPRYLSGELVHRSKGLKWYHNSITKKSIQCEPGTEPTDFIPGMLPRKK